MMVFDVLLPEPCLTGMHIPAIVSRCGGESPAYRNTCGKCWRVIVRADGQLWRTEDQPVTTDGPLPEGKS